MFSMNPHLNVDDFERAAREKLDASIYDYIAGGSWDEATLAGNVAAFDQWRLRPRVMVNVEHRDIRVSVLGETLTLPIGVSPSAFHKLLHVDGELATARAAGAAGTVMCVSMMATVPLEDVASVATGPLWLQTYIFKDRALTTDLAERARAAGYRALVLTVDTPVLGRRERDFRNHFELPAGIGMPNVRLPNAVAGSYESPMARFSREQFDPSLSWRDVEWFAQSVQMPVLVKGVLHPGDAELAAESGASGVIVSNHGGRQLDGAITTLEALPEIVAALSGTRLEVIVDGGIRRGTDVVKALALGAKMVMVGRPVLWGLAVDGETGARAVLELLRAEFDTALALIGCRQLSDLNADYLRRQQNQTSPPGFCRNWVGPDRR
jgi:4-hydroxymandelate oxidase